MPVGTPVHKMYMDLLSKGMDQPSAAKIAQAKTGLSLVTGKPPKSKGYNKSGAGYHGQYGRS